MASHFCPLDVPLKGPSALAILPLLCYNKLKNFAREGLSQARRQIISGEGDGFVQGLRRAALALVIAAAVMLTACRGVIEPLPPIESAATADMSSQNLPETIPADGETRAVGEFYGSYITMQLSGGAAELPRIVHPHSYREVSDYFEATQYVYLYGSKFTILLNSFSDEYLAQNDVILLVINEPSSYVDHDAGPVTVGNGKVGISITRHRPDEAPQNDTVYHLVFIGPKGCFDGVEDMELSIDFTDVSDAGETSAYDAERFRIYNPEFWNFCYRADALTDSPEKVVDIIDGYDELVYFFETYRDDYDLDSEFREYVGTLYNWQICERYIIIATVIPCSRAVEPVTTDLFVNNLEIYMTVDADEISEGETPTAGYLLLTAVERYEMEGVKLGSMNLLVE